VSKRITVTLTAKQWDDVLYAIADGWDHLACVICAGGDPHDIAAWKAALRRIEKVEGKLCAQLKEGGAE
jgi:hypothetical protein